MEQVLVVAVLLALAWLAAATRLLNVTRIVAAFADTFAGWRADPWPHGVQEEDRDRPWGRGGNAPDTATRPQLAAPLGPVRPVTRRR